MDRRWVKPPSNVSANHIHKLCSNIAALASHSPRQPTRQALFSVAFLFSYFFYINFYTYATHSKCIHIHINGHMWADAKYSMRDTRISRVWANILLRAYSIYKNVGPHSAFCSSMGANERERESEIGCCWDAASVVWFVEPVVGATHLRVFYFYLLLLFISKANMCVRFVQKLISERNVCTES